MSDGPLKSLRMSSKWKLLAKSADTAAYSKEDVAEAIAPALSQDWKEIEATQVLRKVRVLFTEDPQLSLLSDDKGEQLGALRSLVIGVPLGERFLDNLEFGLHRGLKGEDLVKEATVQTLVERFVSGSRQMEEHWLRESNANRTLNLRHKLESAFSMEGIVNLASRLLSGAKSVKMIKQRGLDDGISLA